MNAANHFLKCFIFSLLVCFAQNSSAQLVANFSAPTTSGCNPLLVNFQDQSSGNPVSWRWNLGNGTISNLQNPSATYFTPGVYNIKLVVTNAAGLKDSLTKTQYITVYEKPIVNFGSDKRIGCFPLQIQFSDLSTVNNGTVTSWLWDFGDGFTSTEKNPSHTYASQGIFTVTLFATSDKGCINTLIQRNYITVSDGVIAGFNYSAPQNCQLPESISFQNTSTGSGQLSYQWSFGDGNTSTQLSPTHVYTIGGTFSVRLIVTNVAGCTDTIIKNNIITVGNRNIDFSYPDNICLGNGATFTNTSTPVPSTVLWTFGDGSSSTQINPVKIYSALGTYTVRLINYFSACSDTLDKTITVLPKPLSAFTGDPLANCQAPLTVNFTNTSSNSASSQWLFGDGNISTDANPVHTYTANGSYTVTLISTSANGCTDTLTRSDYVRLQRPVISFVNPPDSGCAPLFVSFTPTVSSVDPVVSYQWYFGDGTTSSLQNPTHVYDVGAYNVQLIVTTAGGCSDTLTKIRAVVASLKPQANFIATPLITCAKNPVNFTDLSLGDVNSWQWDFGDGGISNVQNPTYEYQDTGLFTIRLIVGNSNCFDTIVFTNYIQILPPIAKFNFINNCDQKFTKNFTDASIGADEWLWNFGDGNTSTLQNPTHTYAALGYYTVKLVVRNNTTGCDHETTMQVVVSDEIADFTADRTRICRNTAVVFTAFSVNAVNNIVSYEWDYGDGTQGTGQVTTHNYSLAGTYTIKLIIVDVNGCADTLLRDLYIRVNGPDADFVPSVSGSCVATTVVFTDLSVSDGVNPINTWIWDFGDGTIQSYTAPPFSHLYSSSGAYSVKLKVIDATGCADSIFKVNALVVSTPMANFFTADTIACPGSPIEFFNSSTGPNLTYVWDFGDGNQSTATTPSHSYTVDGEYTIRLTVTDQYGCVNTAIKPQYIKVITPVARFNVNDSVATCPPLLVQFTNTSTNVLSSFWDFGDASSSVAANPSHLYTTPGTFIARLNIVSYGGCTSTVTKTIVIKGPTGSFAYIPLSGCAPFTATFRASTMNRSSFIWDFSDGTTLATTDSIITHTYLDEGYYVPKMILKDIAGCSVPIEGIDTIKVTGTAGGFTANTTVSCDSTIVQFTNNVTSSAGILSYAWDFDDGTTSIAASPSHLYSGPGMYNPRLTVTTLNGCVNTFTLPVPIRIVASPVADFARMVNGCVPLTVSTTARLLQPDSSAISWAWYINGTHVGTGSNPVPFIFTTAGTYNISLLATNSSGCTDTVEQSITAYPIPVVDAGLNDFICQGIGKTLLATGANTYVWSPVAGLSCTTCPNPIATPADPITYRVTGTSSFGCVGSDTVKIDVVMPITIVAGRADTVCIGGGVTLSTSGASSYVWSPSAGLNTSTGTTVRANPTTTTTFRVIGTDAKSCFSDTAYFPIKVYPIPTVKLRGDTTISIGTTITLTPQLSADVTSVIWQNPMAVVSASYPSITVRPTGPTQYTARVTNPGGCTTTASVNISVKCTTGNVFIPNTFSPNGDGANDIFYVRGSGISQVKQMKIFNRWGEEVFSKYGGQANDIRAGWDGTYQGKKLSSDVFVYIVEVLCEDNTTLTLFKGNIALIL